ncbi:phytoene/squalene synthase family protein [Acuticoccus mangrovi]|uniref:Phytoene/squalene synthase family protein n=1 Tax=Acuticoccus mangrovi TaxID=2796142 RepID=A0A934IRF9_9HYPH|nr:phytoene/squalene synthase family protein [Acuticoccus mangrovi]
MTGAADYAHRSLANGSKSFSAAARLLPATARDDIARLYAWCRHCDDVIDGQVSGHGGARVEDAAERLAALTRKTDRVLAGEGTGDAVFDGFGAVAARHGISPRLVHDVLGGFAMDVDGARYATLDDLLLYCYGVAGAVGVMMALVLGVAPQDGDTLDRAADLGLAFQLTNIARDVVADAAVGRVYLPAQLLAAEGVAATPEAVADPANAAAAWRVADRLVGEAEHYYASAAVGVARLPYRAAWGIASAGAVYRAIGRRRRAGGPSALALRVGTSTADKAALIAGAAVTALVPEGPWHRRDRAGLWVRPPRP